MRGSAQAVAMAAVGIIAFAAATPAKADRCVVVPPAYEGYAPITYSYRYDPYMWSGLAPNYSNFTPADCGYYDRRFYGAYVIYPRVRHIVRYYRR